MLVPSKIARATYGAEARHALATTTTLIAVADSPADPRPRSTPPYTRSRWSPDTRVRRPGTGSATRLAVGGPTVRQAALTGVGHGS
jgi:hypothetical protein